MKKGRQTYILEKKIYIADTATIAGVDEGKGRLRDFFDFVIDESEFGCKSHEKAEIKLRKHAIESLLKNAGINAEDVDAILGGDLLNQLVPSAFSAREFDVPFCGLYSACATFGQALATGAMLLQSGAERVVCCTSSHFATAERQYRFPLELGTQPPPTAQWTVTGAGCALLTTAKPKSRCPKITAFTLGKAIDMGLDDPNNMGAAMAPAAYDTISAHLKERGVSADYYDLIVTGDLGKLGRELLCTMLEQECGAVKDKVNDCGCMIFKDRQKCGLGGSGAGCSSLVFCSYLYKTMKEGGLKRILLVPTGAMLSKDSSLQGESIPAIAHAVAIET